MLGVGVLISMLLTKISRTLSVVLALAMIAMSQGPAGENAVPNVSQSSDPVFAAARRLLNQGKFDEAIADLQKIAEQNPGHNNLAHEFGLAYYKKGDYIKAIESLKKALSEDPADNEATQLVGL